MTDYENAYAALLDAGIFAQAQAQKSALLLRCLNSLTQHHVQHCDAYARIVGDAAPAASLTEVPYLAVRLFKLMHLSSIPDNEVFRTLTSSGTTGQTPARITLDRETSARQSKALVAIMQQFIGKQRLPMLIIDSPDVVRNPAFSARAAGIQGMAFFGRKPVYALNEDMSLNVEAVSAFCEAHQHEAVLIFGFTFMVWLHFVQALEREGMTLSLTKGRLIHSGGWKKLIDQQVDNTTFKRTLKAVTGVPFVHNFYGMAEQVGSVFVECEQGHLHASGLSDVIVRDPVTLRVAKTGETGLIQVLSAIPTSYPGHSLLTEDLGYVLGADDCACGRPGRYFHVTGRLPKAEIRGCSDTGGSV
ncbi:LuxE/PaaK family acyltransferase [Alteromonas sp. CYL-A6]|uniref:LuxE/PaaK family acyltransferase n=1 Tax=Alteromonas nitratireducens TaxID=3390813 RepID=UPI0034B09159